MKEDKFGNDGKGLESSWKRNSIINPRVLLILQHNQFTDMHRDLLKEAFKKAQKETGSDMVTHLSKHISDFIIEDSKEPYGERILRDNYNKIIKSSEEKINLRAHAADSLSHYLGYENYIEFVGKNKSKNQLEEHKPKTLKYRNTIVIGFIFILLISIIMYNYVTRQRWMVWNEDHYVEINFDVTSYDVNQIKAFKGERIAYFKKVTPPCNYPFFNENGRVIIWYGKNKGKELEYFTALGLHPETGKTLKPITQYMIDKHICK